MATAAAERMRRMRERKRLSIADPLLFERPDWRLFVDPRSLAQKAGCEPHQLGQVIAKEVADNALDSGAGDVTVDGGGAYIRVSDNGPGIAPDKIATVFSVNRPLLSSKLKRLPTRGMLRNGLRVVMGAVVAFGGKITVTTRGQKYELAHDSVTGATEIAGTSPAEGQGTIVEIRFPGTFFRPDDLAPIRHTVRLAGRGRTYDGPSHPRWYGPDGLQELFAAAPNGITVGKLVCDVFGIDMHDSRLARALTANDIAARRPCRSVAV